MNNINILIYNPLKSNIAQELDNIVTEHFKSLISVRTIENFDLSTDDGKTSIIFIILSHCNGIDIPHQIDQKTLYKKQVPQITVLGCGQKCSDCPFLHKIGWDFLTIPLKPQEVILTVNRYSVFYESFRYHDFVRVLKNKASLNILQGNSPVMMEVKNKLLQVAPFNINVFLKGETGTGKELCAKIIHFCSNRSDNPFVPVNCGAIPGELLENELFGHKKGAYTNADSHEMGMVGSAQNGTLFLDEIESMSPAAQVKLLRFLEEKRYKPLGYPGYKEADVRIITAAKDNLEKLVRKGKIREDLYYRINVVQISLPPLNKRLEDIPLLANYFIERYSALYTKKITGMTSLALLKLLNYPWPGNVRELENSIQEAVVTCDSEWIDVHDISLNKIQNTGSYNTIEPLAIAKRNYIKNFERTYLENMLEVNNGNISKSARLAQKDRRSFCRLMLKYNINPAQFRK